MRDGTGRRNMGNKEVYPSMLYIDEDYKCYDLNEGSEIAETTENLKEKKHG